MMRRSQRGWRLSLLLSLGVVASGLGVQQCGHATCSNSSDCSSDETCVFGNRDGCAAKGICASPGTSCSETLVSQLCGCDGRPVYSADCVVPGGFLAPVSGDLSCLAPDGGSFVGDAGDANDDVASFTQDSGMADVTQE
jgi:hypothetical protein